MAVFIHIQVCPTETSKIKSSIVTGSTRTSHLIRMIQHQHPEVTVRAQALLPKSHICAAATKKLARLRMSRFFLKNKKQNANHHYLDRQELIF